MQINMKCSCYYTLLIRCIYVYVSVHALSVAVVGVVTEI